jgi:uncharacterized protein
MTNASFDQIYQLALQLSAADRQKLIEELSASAPPLTKDMILTALVEHAETLRGLGVARLGVFGSYVRGEARLDSDLDLLVQMADHDYSYSDLFSVQSYLEKLFEPRIDLIPEDAIKPRVRPQIMSEVIYAEGF